MEKWKIYSNNVVNNINNEGSFFSICMRGSNRTVKKMAILFYSDSNAMNRVYEKVRLLSKFSYTSGS